MDPTTHDPDREDVRRVLAGDPGAFEGIVRRWQGPLVNLAWRFCRDRAAAEDMAQEAFVRAYRKLDRYRDEGKFSTWLFALALNVYRSSVRRVRLPEVPLEADRKAAAVDSPADRIVREQTGEVVRRTVARLPAKYRDALVLVYFGEMDVAGAAATIGVPEGTLKARLHRGRELLRKRLAGVVGPARQAEAT